MNSVLSTIIISVVASVIGWYIPALRRSYGNHLRRYTLASIFSTLLLALVAALL